MAVTAGNARALNAAMAFKGDMRTALGDIERAHAVASDALVQLFDNGGAIALGGGGGR